MDDPRAADGVEHLQSAARELVAAARSFLDVVERVVEDDERFTGAAGSLAEMVMGGLGAVTGREMPNLRPDREPAWMRNDPDHPDATDDEPAQPTTVDLTTTAGATAGITTADLIGDDDDDDADPEPRPAPRRRVKRIAVD